MCVITATSRRGRQMFPIMDLAFVLFPLFKSTNVKDDNRLISEKALICAGLF